MKKQENNQGKELVKQLKETTKNEQKRAILNSAPVLMIKGIWLFAEGVGLLICSLYAIYQGHYAALPNWGAIILTVAGALVLVPAAVLLSKFFRSVAKA